MLDFNYIWVDIECPKCKYQDRIQLIDAKTDKSIFCNNCKSIIRLHDKDASTHYGIDNINNALKDLDDLFKNLGK